MNYTYLLERFESFEPLIRGLIQHPDGDHTETFEDTAAREAITGSHQGKETNEWQTIIGSIVMLLGAKQVASQIAEPRFREETMYSLEASIAHIIANCRNSSSNKKQPVSDSSLIKMLVTGLALAAESYPSGSPRNELLQIVAQIDSETEGAAEPAEQDKIAGAQADDAQKVSSRSVNSQRITLYTPSVNDFHGCDD